MKADQVDVPAGSMFRDIEQSLHAVESGFAREIVRDVLQGDPRDRVDDDVTVVHRVAAADFDVEMLPDADAATDSSAADSFSKLFREDHRLTGLSGSRDRRSDKRDEAVAVAIKPLDERERPPVFRGGGRRSLFTQRLRDAPPDRPLGAAEAEGAHGIRNTNCTLPTSIVSPSPSVFSVTRCPFTNVPF